MFLTLSGHLSAEDCPEVNLYHEDLGLEHIPYFDQGETYLCYGYAATVLVDSKRYTQGPLEGVSSPFILAASAVDYSQRLSRRSNFWGGLIDHALLAAANDGVCETLHGGLPGLGPEQTLAKLRAFLQLSRQGDDGNAVAQKLSSFLLEHIHHSLTQEQLVYLLGQREEVFLGQLLTSLCERTPVALPTPQSQDRSFGPGIPPIGQRISQLLEQHHPVAVEFCAEVVLDPQFSSGWSGVCARHYAVVLAQRKDEHQQCQVLVRDSQCSVYDGRCHKPGHYWISKRALMSNTFRITWL